MDVFNRRSRGSIGDGYSAKPYFPTIQAGYACKIKINLRKGIASKKDFPSVERSKYIGRILKCQNILHISIYVIRFERIKNTLQPNSQQLCKCVIKLNKMKNLILLLTVTVSLLSCSNPLDKPYKEATLEEDAIELKKVLSEDELGMLAGYIALKSFGEDKMIGKTYRDLLEEAKKVRKEMEEQEAEEQRLAEKAKADEAERIKKLGAVLTVSLFEKGYVEVDYQEFITYKFAFENKSEKDIKAFTGTVYFNDLFDKEITNLSLTFDEGIPANSTIKWDASTEYNQFRDTDQTLKSKDLENLKIRWVPAKVLFKDGSTLE